MSTHTSFRVRSRAVILHDGKLLIVKHRKEADYYALPGGHLEAGESPLECIEREIKEELGVVPLVGRLLYIHTFKDKGVTDTIELFFEVKNGADYVQYEDEVRTHAYELAEVRWMQVQDTLTLLPKAVGDDFIAGNVLSDTIRYTKA